MIGHYLRGLEGDYHAYFLGAPRLYWKFGSMTFLAPDVTGEDIVDPLDAPPASVKVGGNVVFLVLPERATELRWVEQVFPEGDLEEFRDVAGNLRFSAYEVRR
jgi:hypothetical protein